LNHGDREDREIRGVFVSHRSAEAQIFLPQQHRVFHRSTQKIKKMHHIRCVPLCLLLFSSVQFILNGLFWDATDERVEFSLATRSRSTDFFTTDRHRVFSQRDTEDNEMHKISLWLCVFSCFPLCNSF
jgi:hypothetical protein